MKAAFLGTALLMILPSVTMASEAEATLPLKNFREAGAGIYLGARPATEDGLKYLAGRGIKTDINLQGGDNYPGLRDFEPGETPEAIAAEREWAQKYGLAFRNAPLSSVREVDFEESISVFQVLETMHQQKYRPVFVHCEHGVDRTGMILALYRVFYEGWTAEKAKAEWVAAGHGTLNSIFTHDLDEYFDEVVRQLRP